MHKHYLLIPATYLAFVWQAALRPDIAWHGYSPNFLVLVLIAALWSLSDISALIAAAMLGLLSDSLAARHLGSDMLCYLTIAVLLQVVCPPKLLRHHSLVVALVLVATILIEFSTTALRATLNQQVTAADGTASMNYLRWGLISLGDGFYTALIAVLPLLALSLWKTRISQTESRQVGNRWHRLTS